MSPGRHGSGRGRRFARWPTGRAVDHVDVVLGQPEKVPDERVRVVLAREHALARHRLQEAVRPDLGHAEPVEEHVVLVAGVGAGVRRREALQRQDVLAVLGLQLRPRPQHVRHGVGACQHHRAQRQHARDLVLRGRLAGDVGQPDVRGGRFGHVGERHRHGQVRHRVPRVVVAAVAQVQAAHEGDPLDGGRDVVQGIRLLSDEHVRVVRRESLRKRTAYVVDHHHLFVVRPEQRAAHFAVIRVAHNVDVGMQAAPCPMA